MEKYLSLVTIDVWTLIFTWVNLFILFMLVKKLFVKPLKSMLDARETEVSQMYSNAQTAESNAKMMEAEYTEKIKNAKEEAGQILQNAKNNAKVRSDEIIIDAQKKASDMIEKAHNKIEVEKKEAFMEIQSEITGLAVTMAGKLVENELDSNTHKVMMEKIIDEMGENNE